MTEFIQPPESTPTFTLHFGDVSYNIGSADTAIRLISFTAIGIREGRRQSA